MTAPDREGRSYAQSMKALFPDRNGSGTLAIVGERFVVDLARIQHELDTGNSGSVKSEDTRVLAPDPKLGSYYRGPGRPHAEAFVALRPGVAVLTADGVPGFVFHVTVVADRPRPEHPPSPDDPRRPNR